MFNPMLLSSSLRLRIGSVLFCAGLWLFPWVQSFAQGQGSTTGGWTPPGIAPGAPAGSFPLSGIEQINPFNGSMSAVIPLLQVGGRGEAGYTIPLRITPDPWIVQSQMWSWYDTYSEQYYYYWAHYATHNWWNEVDPGYGPGVMHARISGGNIGQLANGDYVYNSSLTKLTFTAPDGTEYEFVDQATGGAPGGGGTYRGREWTTRDNGTSATFISDTPYGDLFYTYGGGATSYTDWATGDLYMKNGVRYRILNGLVQWMRDRNGNKVSFTYDTSKRITKAIDSLNREITFEYAVYEAPYGLCDRITWHGSGGQTRIIRITRTNLINCLRTGSSLQAYGQLFPQLGGGGTYNPANLVSTLWLPDNRYYQFRYNSYGELARIELPTGGGMEYDYDRGDASLTGAGVYGPYWITGPVSPEADPPRLAIFRRMSERRVYSNAANNTMEAKIVYDLPTVTGTIGSETSTTVVRNQDASGTQINANKHYFYGSVIGSLTWDELTGVRPWWETKEYQTEALDAGSVALQKIANTWSAGALPGGPQITDTTTTLSDTNQISKQHFEYDIYGNVTRQDDYDFGSGAVGAFMRRTDTTYLTTHPVSGAVYDNTYPVNTSLPIIHLRSLLSKVQIFSDINATTKKAETRYEYDIYSGTYHAALLNRPNISGWDSSYTTSYTTRGNITATTRYANAAALSGAVNTYPQYDIVGNAVATIDANNNTTTIDFGDHFGAPDGNAQSNDTIPYPGSSWLNGQNTYAFPSKVTNAMGHIAYTQFDYFLGKPVDTEDPNGIKSSLYYGDALDRPTQVRSHVTNTTTYYNQTTIAYDDNNRVITTTSDKENPGDNVLTSKAYYDGLGRTWRTASYQGVIGGQAKWDIVETQFDALGRAYRSCNPFRGDSPTEGLPTPTLWTTTTFDSLGRITQVTTPDGAHADTNYSGNNVTVTDQAGKNRKSETDALGRLKKVWENPTGLNFQTDYSYDVLGNLLIVTQGAQSRAFVYDSLNRLTQATNPESGTISYTYDNNSNLLTKTDARTAKTTFAYDALNRVTSKTYSGTSTAEGIPAANATAPVYYKYDNQAFPSGAPAGFNRGFAIGRLVAVTYGSSTASTGSYYGYDELGRGVRKTQQINGNNYPVLASYNRASLMSGETYPSLHTVSYSYNTAGQLATFSGYLGDGQSRTYVSSASYSAAGQREREAYGTDTPLYLKAHYNKRQQLVDLRLGSVNDEWNWNRGCLTFTYGTNARNQGNPFLDDTDNNGNVRRMVHYVPTVIDGTGTETSWVIPQLADYEYDALNRLVSMAEVQSSNNGNSFTYNVAGQTYSYDRYGNRNITAVQGNVNSYSPSYSPTTNRIVGLPYDSAGNILNDGTKTMAYDAENRMVSATGGSYIYDGEGKRVKRTATGQEWWYIYGPSGELVAEYLATQPSVVKKEYGYRAGKLLMVWDDNETTADKKLKWIVGDHLNSTRLEADKSGSLGGIVRHDYLPFGEELTAGIRINGQGQPQYGYVGSNISHRFTSKERDTETGFDFFGARYYSGTMGRWLIPDWSEAPEPIPHADITDPQSLNLYCYLHNNPLSDVDPDGHAAWWEKVKNGLRGKGFKTDDEVELGREESYQDPQTKLGQQAAKAEKWLLEHGAKKEDLDQLSNRQIVDLYEAVQRGDNSVTTEGRKIEINVTVVGQTQQTQQLHHFATNKSKTWTPQMQKIAKRYGLELDGAWNKEMLVHSGRHTNTYHRFVLRGMQRAAKEAGNDKEKFLRLYEKYVKAPIRKDPGILYRK